MKTKDSASPVPVREAAKALGVSPQTVRVWCRAGARHTRRGTAMYVEVRDLEAWRDRYRTGHVEGAHGGGRPGAGRPKGTGKSTHAGEGDGAGGNEAREPSGPSRQIGPLPMDAAGMLRLIQEGDVSVAKMDAIRKAVQALLALEARERERGGLIEVQEVRAVMEIGLARMRGVLEQLGPELAAWAGAEFRLSPTEAGALREQAIRMVDAAVARMHDALLALETRDSQAAK